ncbi:helix-turn-helix domain-containing protein [Georgenia alba]|uniref:Helix-turn-helix domain-containing protein n=1 Tax=Georgenia alba TaxID=2233858 RepID=A0ABW2Q5D0_9MICO
MTVAQESVGTLLRQWRERRHRSQLDVSIAADVSTRHLSFVETGRSAPSRQMIERLCDELEVPLRERNVLHLAAGFAPVHQERPLEDLDAARAAIDAVLAGHEPYPAVAVNVRWELLAANESMSRFLGAVPDRLRQPRLNILRATLHPDGLAPQLRNYGQWRAHVLRRVRRQLERTAAEGLAELLAELESYPAPDGAGEAAGPADSDGVVVPLVLATPYGELRLSYVLSVFGAPRDVTLEEIAIESFFPADDETRRLLQSLAG